MTKIWRRLQTSTVLASLVVIIFGCVVYAATTLITIPAEVTIIGANPIPIKSVAIYNDAACTSPASKIYFGTEVVAGTVVPWDVYVKNTGNVDVSVMAQATPDISAWGSLGGMSTPAVLTPNQIMPVTLTLTVNSGAVAGLRNFNIDFNEP